jgi:protein-tyrosine-phosphatase
MQELGIDISDAPQQKLTPEVAKQAALLVTMGCGEACPYVPGQPLATAASRLVLLLTNSHAHMHSMHAHLPDFGAGAHQCSCVLVDDVVSQ